MAGEAWRAEVERIAAGIRRRVLSLTIERNGCYLSQALSSAETLAVLYARALRLGDSEAPVDPVPFPGVPGPEGRRGVGAGYNGPRGAGCDRLLISPAHYAVAVYAALVEAGRLSEEGFASFNTDGSTVEMIGGEHSPGFELTTGSFGQALSQAGGIAMAKRMRGEDDRVFVYMSDGELQEGQTWEAVQAIAFHGLTRVVVVCDVNGQQVDGDMSEVMNIEPISSRVEAFGCACSTVDGHDIDALDGALTGAGEKDRPEFVLAYTDSARGIPELAGRKPKLHFVRFRDEEEVAAYRKVLERMEAEA